MASTDIQIDDDYCESMKKYYIEQGMKIEEYLSEYITILENISKNAVKKGDVNIAIDAYITYAKKLKGQINNMSNAASNQISNFLKKVDEVDQYLF
ncbi:MAG: hypothetical protein K6B67_04920 [Lachnospiraceae bacterium]|nr:hypothetical protein [Lachnospiraceae bacterium]